MAENIKLCGCGRRILWSTRLEKWLHIGKLSPTQEHDGKPISKNTANTARGEA